MGFEGGDETTGEERTGEFFFRQHAGGGSHGAAGFGVRGETLECVREGGDIARRYDNPAAIFL